MSIRPTSFGVGETWTWNIRLRNVANAAVDADSTPTVTVYKNNSATGESVTVTKPSATTGWYQCSFDPAGEAEHDVYSFVENVTIASVAQAPFQWEAVVLASVGAGGLDAAGVRAAVGLASANMDTQLSGINNKTTNLPSDPADQSLVEAAITAATSGLASQSVLNSVKAKTDNLPTDPADQSQVEAAITSATSGLASQSSLNLVKTKTDNLPSDPADQSSVEAAITAATSGLASQSDLTAVKAKTDNLPSDPADQSSVEAAITSATSGLASQSSLNSVKAKTDNLPSDPADQSSVEAAITAAVNSLISSGLALQSTLLTVKAKTDNLPSDPADQSSVEAAINSSVTSIVQSLTDLISNLDIGGIDEIDAKIDDLALNAITRDYLNAAILNAVASVNSTKNRVILGPAEKCVFDGKYRRPSS